ncbi:iron ABC transporter permease [Gordonia spumicola]|uniref:Iron ABC transporter permease n=1 Tax=Gordonia spumicola TaxID=589161 RepID=A0A7I9VC80_9ACTN|nr:iron ABC transporter permease [Gordonia spumicola]
MLEPVTTENAPAKVRARRWIAVPVCLAILAAAVVLSLAIGARFTPIGDVIAALIGSGDQDVINIVGTLRVDRTINALICGVALGLSGVLMQAVTRNPLADPGVLGVNAGAAFGVVAGMSVFGVVGSVGTVWLALAGAAAASAVILAFSSSRVVAGSPVRFTLAGVAFAAILSGVTQTLVITDESVLDTYRFWRVGSLTARPVADVAPVVAIVAVGAVLALSLSSSLNALALGDDSARSLGARPVRVRVLSLVAVALLAGSATALAGPIAFVGLVVPHLLRPVVGPDHRLLLPLSLICSPALLLVADIIGRVIGRGGEVQAGVVTALIGGPLLIFFVNGRQTVGLS